MSRPVFSICILVVLTSVSASTCLAQESAKEQDLAERVATLENRVAHLERLLFTTTQLSEYEARRRLAEAKIRKRESERLHLRGHLSIAQVEYDRFVVQRAERELDMALAREGQFRIAAEIDVLQAEYDVRLARQQLRFNEEKLGRGFVTADQVAHNERQVTEAERLLAAAQEKLAAIQNAELDGLQPGTQQNQPEYERQDDQ
ncbi:MAG: hypothetical protein ACR2NP_17515 [Pirellulaceae bacterium]